MSTRKTKQSDGGLEQVEESFIISVSDAEVRRERDKARALRKTRWWKQRLASGVCHYCGRRFSPDELTMDHIVPIIRGGKTTKGNVAVVCKECNNKKKYLLPMEWEEYLSDFAVSDEEEM
jgi:5-methylcytosine-specific restriction endonuclease McrA